MLFDYASFLIPISHAQKAGGYDLRSMIMAPQSYLGGRVTPMALSMFPPSLREESVSFPCFLIIVLTVGHEYSLSSSTIEETIEGLVG
jgi:hypothetical protein